MWRVKAKLYCISFNREMKTLYANRGKPNSISILMLAAGCINNNHVS